MIRLVLAGLNAGHSDASSFSPFSSLGRADKELRRLQSQLDRQMQKMQRSVSEAEADYQVVPQQQPAVVTLILQDHTPCST